MGQAVREPETGPFLRRMRPSDLPAVMGVDAAPLPKPWRGAIWRRGVEGPFGV